MMLLLDVAQLMSYEVRLKMPTGGAVCFVTSGTRELVTSVLLPYFLLSLAPGRA